MIVYVGGIGDMLQFLPKIIKENKKEIYVESHQPNIDSVFTPFGISVNNTMKLKPSQIIPATDRTYYLDGIQTPRGSLNQALIILKGITKPIVGIHPIGSRFSNEYWFQRGQPIKLMPPEFVKKIVSNNNYHFLLFGTDEEIDEYYGDCLEENVTAISYQHIWDSLAFVDFCDKVIAVDSAIKSYSLMRHKPTLLYVGDYRDDLRDELFINPYLNSGKLTLCKFRSFDEKELKIAEEFLCK